MGFPAAIESLNNRWQRKVWDRISTNRWQRFRSNLACMWRPPCAAMHAASRKRLLEKLFSEGPAPGGNEMRAWPQGRLILIRRADNRGHVTVLGNRYCVGREWPSRLVRWTAAA